MSFCASLSGRVLKLFTSEAVTRSCTTRIRKRTVTIPMHPGDLGKKLISRILKQAGLTIEDFLKLL